MKHSKFEGFSQKTKDWVEEIYAKYHKIEFLSSDPVEFVHHYKDPLDQEVVALIASLLAYGNRKQIRKSIQNTLHLIHDLNPLGPKAFVASASIFPSLNPELHKRFETINHRFNSGTDLLALLVLIRMSWEKFGSVGAHFTSYLDLKDEDFSKALSEFIADWRKQSHSFQWLKKNAKNRRSFDYLLTSPQSGSCCKRWVMFLRWMGRKDEIDLGLWMEGSALLMKTSKNFLKPSQLVFPLDTHLGQIAKKLKITHQKSLNWKSAIQVTEAFRFLDREDPLKYDFSLCRSGMFQVREKVKKT